MSDKEIMKCDGDEATFDLEAEEITPEVLRVYADIFARQVDFSSDMIDEMMSSMASDDLTKVKDVFRDNFEHVLKIIPPREPRETITFDGTGEELFASLKEEADTKIISRKYFQWEGFDLVKEKWVWDGIIGHSLIFVSFQIQPLDDGEVKALAKKILVLSEAEEESCTFRRKTDFTYFNYGFESPL